MVLVGGSGGAGRNFSGEIDHAGGLGGTATANLEVNPGEVLEIRVGGGVSFGVGGFNGGGSAATTFGGGGGGASDIRQGGSDLADRVVVAGGGGGGSTAIPDAATQSGVGARAVATRDHRVRDHYPVAVAPTRRAVRPGQERRPAAPAPVAPEPPPATLARPPTVVVAEAAGSAAGAVAPRAPQLRPVVVAAVRASVPRVRRTAWRQQRGTARSRSPTTPRPAPARRHRRPRTRPLRPSPTPTGSRTPSSRDGLTSPADVTVTFVGGPRDGESARVVSGEPPAVLVVDGSGGRYVYRDGCYFWEGG